MNIIFKNDRNKLILFVICDKKTREISMQNTFWHDICLRFYATAKMSSNPIERRLP